MLEKGIAYIPMDEYAGYTTKIRFKCNKGHEFYATPKQILLTNRGHSEHCPYCLGSLPIVGETDLWTTRPDVAMLLFDKDVGYTLKENSNKKVDFVCPTCGAVLKDKYVGNVSKQGLSCEFCSDGISFSEKFVSNMLTQLGADFIHDRCTPWSNNRRYDFYVDDMSLIIETHGAQHYKQIKNRRDEKPNDMFKRNMAKENGIRNYVELDCRISSLEYVVDSIKNSLLSDLFNLSKVNWTDCLNATKTTNVSLVCSLWNDGVKSPREISDITGIHISSVIPKLKLGRTLGLCDYIEGYKRNKNRCKQVMCVETGKIYESILSVKEDGYCNVHVSNCCNNKCDTAYGLHWKFIDYKED